MKNNLLLAALCIFSGVLFHRYNVKTIECQKLKKDLERLRARHQGPGFKIPWM